MRFQAAWVALWGTALLLATECFAQGPTDNPTGRCAASRTAAAERSRCDMGETSRRPRDGPARVGACRH